MHHQRRTVLAAAAVLVLSLGLAATSGAACKAPRVLIILDKSSSMLGIVDGKTKWEHAKAALGSLLSAYDQTINFGLMIFPNPNQCGPGSVKVAIGANKGTAILNKLADPPPSGGNWTPMAQSLDQAPKVTALQDAGYSNHVLLITDGWQWCSPYSVSTRFLPVNSVANLTALGIKTHVVGFGDGVDTLTLNKMAAAAKNKVGSTCNVAGEDPAASNNCYYQANNVKQLLNALKEIAKKITNEVCDGEDNDCNGLVDDGLTGPACPKQTGVCKGATRVCNGAAGWKTGCDVDTYDLHAQSNGHTYQAVETACDGQDNDCDGTVDEGCACVNGQTRPCGLAQGACKQGTQTCKDGQWSACDGEVAPTVEVCDGLDNDCDGQTDEGLTRQCSSACGAGTQSCQGGQWADCTAPQPSAEICDGLDNDCDGLVDGPTAYCENGGSCINGTCVTQTPRSEESGCDCDAASDGSAGAGGALALAALLALALLRRRRRATLS